MTDQPFILGVNYWPQQTAMFMWRDFHKEVVDEDMEIVKSLGLSCIRIYLLWEDFQPTPKTVPTVMLDRLVEVLDTAAEKNIKVVVTLFTGHACSMNWLPPWMLLASTERGQYQVFSLEKVRSNKIRNPYAEAEIMEAQVYLLKELTNAVCGHPALFSWDLGNEPSLWAVSPDNFAAELWLQAMTETLRESDDRLPVTLSFHVSDLGRRQGLTLGMAAKYMDYLSINAQPRRVPWAEDFFSPVLPPFLGSVTAWLGKGPVMIQEFGLATKTTLPVPQGLTWGSNSEQLLVSEEDAALFTEDALLHLQRSQFMGAFWKSFGDYHPSIWEWPPLDKHLNERFSGLVRYDGSPKVAASVLTSEPKRCRKERISSEWLDISQEEYYQDPDGHLGRLYGRFREYYSLA
ncbi:MAG: hypothetical protein LJE88_00115 [Deltaproteobacteria bacterium]|nr:hypothetical protein [Deltaproteobacteria bacterium]